MLEAATAVYTTKSLHGDYISITAKKGPLTITYKIDPETKSIIVEEREFPMISSQQIPISKIEDPVVVALLAGRTVNDILIENMNVKIDGLKAAER